MPNSKAKNQHSANKEVLSAIKDLSDKTEKSIKGLSQETDQKFDEALEVINVFADRTESRFSKIDERFSRLDEKFSKFDKRLTRVEASMVTKSYLDEKMSDLRGDLVVLMRKGDVKFKALVGVLHGKKVISQTDVKKIYSMEPFAQ